MTDCGVFNRIRQGLLEPSLILRGLGLIVRRTQSRQHRFHAQIIRAALAAF